MVRVRALELAGAAGLGWLAATWTRLELQEPQTGLVQLLPTVLASQAVVPASQVGLVSGEPPAEPDKAAPRVAQIMRFGFPGLDNIRSHANYVLSYDRRNRLPHWVFEHLTQEGARRAEGVDRQRSEFRPDTSIHPYFRADNKDYKYSGFDRGHMAPAGNHVGSQEHCDQTFLLSNMAPQVGRGFNRDKWEHLERYVRKLTKLYRNVYVCTGPLYLPRREEDGKMWVKYQVIGQNNVSVPTHFYKVVVCETDSRHLEMECFVMPNEEQSANIDILSLLSKCGFAILYDGPPGDPGLGAAGQFPRPARQRGARRRAAVLRPAGQRQPHPGQRGGDPAHRRLAVLVCTVCRMCYGNCSLHHCRLVVAMKYK